MPQLDFSTFASQAFWMILSFCTLWFLLSTLVTPKLADIIEQRKRRIDEYVQKAEKLNMQAKKSLTQYRNTLAEAKILADKEISAAQTELQNYLEEQETQTTARLDKKIADSEFKLAKEKKATMQQIEEISQELAFDIVQKLGFSQITRQDILAVSQKDESV